MKPSKGDVVRIKTLKTIQEDLIINSIKLLGSDKKLKFERNKRYLAISLDDRVQTDLPICFKIELR